MQKQGFTLTEVLVYLAILTILSVLVVSVLMVILRSYSSLRLSRSLQESAVISMERMTREIKQAENLDLVNSIFDINPGKLVLGTGTEFYVDNGTLMIKESAGTAATSTSADITVDNLAFVRIVNEQSEAVRVELAVTATRGNQSRQAKFYSVAVLRGSY